MSAPAKVTVTLEAQSAAFSKNTQAAGAAMRKAGADAKAGEKDVAGFRGALEKLREGAGRGSALDDFGKTLRGAGAVAGITLIGEAVAGVAAKAAELSAEFRKGQIDAAGVAVKIGESLPVIGGFVKAGQSIRELFTHEQEQVDNINASVKAGEAVASAAVEAHKRDLAVRREYTEELRRSNEQLKLALTFDPGKRAVVASGNAGGRRGGGGGREDAEAEGGERRGGQVPDRRDPCRGRRPRRRWPRTGP